MNESIRISLVANKENTEIQPTNKTVEDVPKLSEKVEDR